MKRTTFLCRAATPVLALALALSLSLPTSAFFWNKNTNMAYVEDFYKNCLIGTIISF